MEKCAKRPFRIASLPGRPLNPEHLPYIGLFYDALKAFDVELASEFIPTTGWVRKHSNQIDAVHIHWPEMIWRNDSFLSNEAIRNLRGYYFIRKQTRLCRSLLGLLHLHRLMRWLKQERLYLFWTVHELEPHSDCGWIDRAGYATLAKCSDLIICHSQLTRKSFVKKYGNGSKAVVMEHGNFRTAYPKPRPRNAVRQELGIANSLPVVCLLGALRSYKGVNLAVETAERLRGQVQVLIAGNPHSDITVDAMSRRTAKMENVTFIPRHLSAQEFADFAYCSEAFLLPYRKFTTSGVMQAAFTFHRGIIATNHPYFQEALDEKPDCGRLALTDSPDDLASAILDYLTIPAQRRIQAAAEFSKEHEWTKVILPVAMSIHNLRKCVQED